MKKNHLLLVFSFALLSCNKDESNSGITEFSEQKVLTDFLKETHFDEEYANCQMGYNHEYGMRFIPQVNGVIKSFHIKFPDRDTNVRMTLWDVETGDVLFSTVFETLTINKLESKNIPPFQLLKGREYMISYLNDQFYQRFSRNPSGIVQYPVSIGKINIMGFNSVTVLGATNNEAFWYPNCDASGHVQYAGDFDFVFQETK